MISSQSDHDDYKAKNVLRSSTGLNFGQLAGLSVNGVPRSNKMHAASILRILSILRFVICLQHAEVLTSSPYTNLLEAEELAKKEIPRACGTPGKVNKRQKRDSASACIRSNLSQVTEKVAVKLT